MEAGIQLRDQEQSIDDIDSSIGYSGSWNKYIGSTRQWGGGTTHGTTQVGASATFSFRGTSVTVVGTIPVGTETTTSEYSVDGKAPVSVSFRSGSNAVYDQTFWQSGTLQDGVHSLTITNKASAAEFLLDRIKFIGSEDIPVVDSAPAPAPAPVAPAAPSSITTTPSSNAGPSSSSASSSSSSASGSSSSSSSSDSRHGSQSSESTTGSASQITGSSSKTQSGGGSGAAAAVTGSDRFLTQFITTTTGQGAIATGDPAGTSMDRPSSHSSDVPIGAIVGAVMGGAVLIALVLLFLWYHRQRARRAAESGDDTQAALRPGPSSRSRDLTPFPLGDSDNSSAPELGLMAQIKGAGGFMRMHDRDYLGEGSVSGPSSAANTSPTSLQDSKSASISASPNVQESLMGSLLYNGEVQDGARRRFVGTSISGSSTAVGPSTVVGSLISAPSAFGTMSLMEADDVPPAYHASSSHRVSRSGNFLVSLSS
ncbi:hypothetical protein BDQ12DRAFT_685022 [Crucibulum laeve]|uniref:Uncharacterized protein n=1 Tax=Crucibulum laeve TaxID=68775 RepID=A0A5C3LY63_9AGAR|nr:hypothetical protein BDQ12DRAFT_685022 [Crucibulum laeve]